MLQLCDDEGSRKNRNDVDILISMVLANINQRN